MALPAGCGRSSAQQSEPQFTGPYAAEFKKNYEQTDNALVRGILEDSRITDAEFEEFKDRYESCLRQHDVTWQYDGGGELFGSATGTDVGEDAVNDATSACNPRTGYMEFMPLYESLHWNPDNLDSDALKEKTLACLKKHGFARPNMTMGEYEDLSRDHDRFMAEFGRYMDNTSPDYQRFYACTQDPVNAD